jgi:transcriptional regulator with XRE-family HTH domain
LRRARNLTQEDLVEKLQLGDKAQISRIESGKRRLLVSELRVLAEALNVPLDALVYPDLFHVSYRKEDRDIENSDDMQWFRDFRRRYRAFMTT